MSVSLESLDPQARLHYKLHLPTNSVVLIEEEVLDTLLLVIRNAVQFLRLGNILRRYVFPS